MKKYIAALVVGVTAFVTPLYATTPTEVLFVVMGGRTSCGSNPPAAAGIGMYKPFTKMVAGLKTKFPQKKFHYLVSCLNTSPPPTGTAPYITSENPGVSENGNGEDFKRTIEQFDEKSDSGVFVIGHSYGGWLAMYLAENAKLKSPLQGLYTVDPISTQCGPSGVVFGARECFQAPRDLDNSFIRKQTLRWVNFYQNQDTWLQSGEIDEAENNHITLHGPHNEIDDDATTWRIIESAVLKQLAEN